MSIVVPACLIAAAVPPAWIAATGGADLNVLGLRLGFYRAAGPVIVMGGASLVGLVWGAPGRSARVSRALAAVALAFALAIAWTGGFRLEWISVRGSTGPSLVAGVLSLVACIAGRSAARVGRGSVIAAVGLAVGLLLMHGVEELHRSDLRSRMAASKGLMGKPDVILLLVDTLRADALGTYGASPSPSPFLDGLAADSVVFEQAFAQAPWTVPSVSSLFSGLHPSSYMRSRKDLEPIRDGRIRRLPGGLPWLPAHLREAGYHTAGFQKNPFLQPGTRFERGFEVYELVRGDTAELESAAQLADAILRWSVVVSERRAGGEGGAFFLFAHFMDPHVQYRPPERFLRSLPAYDGPVDGGGGSLRRLAERPGGPTEADLVQLRGRYRGEVSYLDGELRRLHESLASQGLWTAATVVILLSDHGEQFWEHGAFEHRDVYRENVHVPWLLRAPDLAPRRIPGPVGLIDLAPTLLDLLDLPPLPHAEGRSQLPALGALEPRTILTDGRTARDARVTTPQFALVREGGTDRLFDAVADRGETRDLSGELPEVLADLQRTLGQHRSRSRPVGLEQSLELERPIDADMRERLEGLGYVQEPR